MASNVISTTGSTRADMGSATTMTGVLKDVYLPAMQNTVYFDNQFSRIIEQVAGKFDATGRKMIMAFETQMAGGVGPMAEGGSFRGNVPIDAIQGEQWLKYTNAYFELTGPAIATIENGQGAYVDIVDRHMTSLIKTAKLDAERIWMGQGDGTLATLQTIGAGSCTVNGPAFFDTQFIPQGTIIEVHDEGAFGTELDLSASSSLYFAPVTAVTKGSKKTGNRTYGGLTVTGMVADNLSAGDVITRKYAYSGTTCLECDGMNNIISDGASNSETGDNFKNVWGKDRTTYTELASQMVNVDDELDEEILLEAIMENENQYMGNPNMLMFSQRAMLKYFMNSKEDRRFNTMDAFDWTGGYKRLGIQLGSKSLMLTSLNSIKTGTGMMIDSTKFKFMRPPGMTGYKWLTGSDGSIMTQKEGSDNKFATAVDYVNFVCENPGQQCKFYGITE